MPIAIWVALSFFGAALAPQLYHGLDPRTDPIARSHFGKKAKIEYRTWTSSPTRIKNQAGRDTSCTFTVFAQVTQGQVVMQVNGVILPPNTAVWWERTVPVGATFIDEVTFFSLDGPRVATHTVRDTCWVIPSDWRWDGY